MIDSAVLIGALEIRDPACRSQLYCWINERWWGNGYFQQAVMLAAIHYFTQTNEQTISACIDIDNMRSYHAFIKAGFVTQRIRFNQYEMLLSRSYFE
jgi:RimJ/RimL family protein N-acetyltransferase